MELMAFVEEQHALAWQREQQYCGYICLFLFSYTSDLAVMLGCYGIVSPSSVEVYLFLFVGHFCVLWFEVPGCVESTRASAAFRWYQAVFK